MNDRLSQFLKCSASREFDWLHCNCGFWVCEWINDATGVDPVHAYRGRFKTDKEFLRFVRKHGGYEGFSRKVAQEAGLAQTDNPRLGDVGLVHADAITMAIKADRDRWIVKRNGKGVAIAPFPAIVAWGLDCPR